MALNSEVSANFVKDIADQLAILSPQPFTFGAIAREVGETFPIWMIDTESLSNDTTSVSDAAKDISRTTSMVYSGGTPSFSVESRVDGDKILLTSLPIEPPPDQAVKLRSIFDKIDGDFGNKDGVVRQLEAPAYRFSALWLLLDDAEWIYPIESGVSGLEFETRYDWPTIRKSLLHASPVLGLVP